MRKSFVAALAVCGAFMAQPASAAMVVPAPAGTPSTVTIVPAVAGGHFTTGAESAKVIEVRSRRRAKRRNYRRHRHYRGHRHRRSRGWGNFGAGVAAGVVGALIAKGITEASAQERFARCERDFRSFNPATGTYITYSGQERLCPHLR